MTAPMGMDTWLATIRAADELGAGSVPQANLHLQLAKEEAQRAQALVKQNEKERASYVWMRAEADADLALALARESAARGQAQQANQKMNAPKSE